MFHRKWKIKNVVLDLRSAVHLEAFLIKEGVPFLGRLECFRRVQRRTCAIACLICRSVECPLDNKCLGANVVYKAVVSAPSKPDKKYFGIAETSFKDSFRNHARDFCRKKYVNRTELSKYMWKLKDEKIAATIKWNIMSIVHGTPNSGACKLCLTEKFWLSKHFNYEHLLNKKLEFVSKCRHDNKLLVKSAEKG